MWEVEASDSKSFFGCTAGNKSNEIWNLNFTFSIFSQHKNRAMNTGTAAMLAQ